MKKLDITKEDYCQMVAALQEHYKELTEFENAMDKFNMGGTYITTIGSVLVENIIYLLTTLTHDREDKYKGTWLSWWLWEDVEKVVWDAQGNPMDVSTADKLYDFLEATYNAEDGNA